MEELPNLDDVLALPNGAQFHRADMYPQADATALETRNLAEQFRDVLDCVAGDERLASDAIFESADALNVFMREMSARQALAIDVVGPPVDLDYGDEF